MKDPENIREVARLKPDYMGFIFYGLSPRNAIGVNYKYVTEIPSDIKTVGVFVNVSKDVINEYQNIHKLKAVQLHGNESPDLCKFCQRHCIEVIKAVKVPQNPTPDFFESLKPYVDCVDMFLFDAAGLHPGGNGEKFNWEILEKYPFDVPYILSGGIGPEDAQYLKEHLPSKCVGVDVNSRFEIEPGKKNVKALEDFIKAIR